MSDESNEDLWARLDEHLNQDRRDLLAATRSAMFAQRLMTARKEHAEFGRAEQSDRSRDDRLALLHPEIVARSERNVAIARCVEEYLADPSMTVEQFMFNVVRRLADGSDNLRKTLDDFMDNAARLPMFSMRPGEAPVPVERCERHAVIFRTGDACGLCVDEIEIDGYGRSPAMAALGEVKSANEIVNAALMSIKPGSVNYVLDERAENRAAFAASVIAGLVARDWPEPTSDTEHDYFFNGSDGAHVNFYLASDWNVNYETEDDVESGAITFEDRVSAEHVVEAIDRLRWVIGLERSMCIKCTECGESLVNTMQAAGGEWDSMQAIIAEAGSAKQVIADRAVYGVDVARAKSATAFVVRNGTELVAGPFDTAEEALRVLKQYSYRDGLDRDGAAQNVREVSRIVVPETTDPAPDIFALLAQGIEVQKSDRDGALVALPAKPAPKEERPYVPTRWIGGDF